MSSVAPAVLPSDLLRWFLILGVLPPTALVSVMVSSHTFPWEFHSLALLISAASVFAARLCGSCVESTCLQHGAAGLGDLTRASLACRASSAADKIRPEERRRQQKRTVRACKRATGVFNVNKLHSNTSWCTCRMLLHVQFPRLHFTSSSHSSNLKSSGPLLNWRCAFYRDFISLLNFKLLIVDFIIKADK